jgi:hypothetical protein
MQDSKEVQVRRALADLRACNVSATTLDADEFAIQLAIELARFKVRPWNSF